MNIQDIYNTVGTKRQKSPAPSLSLINVVIYILQFMSSLYMYKLCLCLDVKHVVYRVR